MFNEAIRRSFLPVVRAVQRTCAQDMDAQRQIINAVRMSVREMQNAQVPESEIVKELDSTRDMLLQNIAQVSFNDSTDSYSLKIREEMIPKDGMTLDIKTPDEIFGEQDIDASLATATGKYSNR